MAVSGPLTRQPPARNSTLRWLALPILAVWGVEIYLGNSLALESGPYATNVLTAHEGVGLLLIVFSAAALAWAVRLRNPRGIVAAVFCFLPSVGAEISGAVFIWGGQDPTPLHLMEGLAVVVLIGILLLLAWGSVPRARAGSPVPWSGKA